MSILNELPKVTTKKSRRLGRGYGSKKGGHTSSRGQKGQKSRSKVAIWFEGGQLPLIRRTPFIKGKLRFKSLNPTPVVIHADKLNVFKDGDKVTLESIAQTLGYDLKELKSRGVKVLNRGKLERKLELEVPASKSLSTK